jgi:hypothetical protein
MQMLGNNELITISRYWKDWADPRLIILVLNNGDLNQVTWEMRALSGNPKYETTQVLPPEYTLENYRRLATDASLWRPITNSVSMALTATVANAAVALPSGWSDWLRLTASSHHRGQLFITGGDVASFLLRLADNNRRRTRLSRRSCN